MVVGGSPTLGDIQNKETVRDKKEGSAAAALSLGIGLVYQDGANGWKIAPVDGSIDARRLYFNGTVLDNSGGVLHDLTSTFYGEGAIVVGQADIAIVVNDKCRASQTAAHTGQFQAITKPAAAALNAIFSDTEVEAALDALRDFLVEGVAIYLGHAGEITETQNEPTDAVDGDTDCLFLIVRH